MRTPTVSTSAQATRSSGAPSRVTTTSVSSKRTSYGDTYGVLAPGVSGAAVGRARSSRIMRRTQTAPARPPTTHFTTSVGTPSSGATNPATTPAASATTRKRRNWRDELMGGCGWGSTITSRHRLP